MEVFDLSCQKFGLPSTAERLKGPLLTSDGALAIGADVAPVGGCELGSLGLRVPIFGKTLTSARKRRPE